MNSFHAFSGQVTHHEYCIREHPFNLKGRGGGGLWFLLDIIFFYYKNNKVLTEYFFLTVSETEFFSQANADRNVFPQQTIAPPLQVIWMFPYTVLYNNSKAKRNSSQINIVLFHEI